MMSDAPTRPLPLPSPLDSPFDTTFGLLRVRAAAVAMRFFHILPGRVLKKSGNSPYEATRDRLGREVGKGARVDGEGKVQGR